MSYLIILEVEYVASQLLHELKVDLVAALRLVASAAGTLVVQLAATRGVAAVGGEEISRSAGTAITQRTRQLPARASMQLSSCRHHTWRCHD